MGDPRKAKKKYFPPRHPWIKERIDAERELVREYSLKRKKEIYKLDSTLKKFKDRAKKLIATKTQQGEKEKNQLMQRLQKLALISSEAALDDILGLNLKDIMERRLQNLLFKKGLARTQSQARQFIIHQHVMIGNKKITSPNYLVSQEEEDLISISPRSKLFDPEHPERTIETKEESLPVRPAPSEDKEEDQPKESKKETKKKTVKTKPQKEKVKEEVQAKEKQEKPKEPSQEEKEIQPEK